jgi:hypothetical protein
MNIDVIFGAGQVTFGADIQFLAHVQWTIDNKQIAICMFGRTQFVESPNSEQGGILKNFKFVVSEFQYKPSGLKSSQVFKFVHTRYYTHKDKAFQDFLSRSNALSVLKGLIL